MEILYHGQRRIETIHSGHFPHFILEANTGEQNHSKVTGALSGASDAGTENKEARYSQVQQCRVKHDVFSADAS